MRRESHVRSCESGRGRLPPATRHAFVTGDAPPGLLGFKTQLVEHSKSGFVGEGTLYLDGSMT